MGYLDSGSLLPLWQKAEFDKKSLPAAAGLGRLPPMTCCERMESGEIPELSRSGI